MMAATSQTIRAHYDGRCFVPDEPVELAPDTTVTLVVEESAPSTWLEKHHGIRLHLRKGSPSLSDTVIEERGAV